MTIPMMDHRADVPVGGEAVMWFDVDKVVVGTDGKGGGVDFFTFFSDGNAQLAKSRREQDGHCFEALHVQIHSDDALARLCASGRERGIELSKRRDSGRGVSGRREGRWGLLLAVKGVIARCWWRVGREWRGAGLW